MKATWKGPQWAADAGAACIVGGRIWQPAITSPPFRPSLVLLSKSGFTASWLPFFSALTGTLAWDKCCLETWHRGCPFTMLHCSCTVWISLCVHDFVWVHCMQSVMNLNYVLVWLPGPGYTTRVWDFAQWRNQGVRLLERALTLPLSRLRSQRWGQLSTATCKYSSLLFIAEVTSQTAPNKLKSAK